MENAPLDWKAAAGSLMVILRETVAELFNSMPAGSVLCAFVQYLIILSSLPDVASGVISGTFVRQIDLVTAIKFGIWGLHRS